MRSPPHWNGILTSLPPFIFTRMAEDSFSLLTFRQVNTGLSPFLYMGMEYWLSFSWLGNAMLISRVEWFANYESTYFITKTNIKSRAIFIIIEFWKDNRRYLTLFLKMYVYYTYIFILDGRMILIIIIIYLILINISTFIIRWIDKWKSIKHKRRISEKELLIFTAAWWFLWAIAWMTIRHHKTIKWKFLWKFWLIVFALIVALCLFYYFLYR